MPPALVVAAEVGLLYLLNDTFEPRRQLLRVSAITNGITYLLPFVPILMMQVGSVGTLSAHRPQLATSRFHRAVRDGDTALVKKLLKRGASPNCTPSENGPKPPHMAVASRQLGIAKLLSDHGADINATAYVGDTPLRCAVYRNNVQAVSLLPNQGAGPKTALQAAQKTSHLTNDNSHRRYERAKSAAAAQILRLIEIAASRQSRPR